MKRIILSILIIIALGLISTETLAQCSCHPNRTLPEHFQNSDAVFVGKVIEAREIQPDDSENTYVVIKFEVIRTWKRDMPEFVLVKESNGSVEGFETDAEWLLFAFKNDDETFRIYRGCCSKTEPLSVAEKQGYFKAFEKMGEKPKKIIKTDD